jgi:hypothetical protein
MRALRSAIVATSALLLHSCSPASLVELYNDTGSTIIVIALDHSVSVPPQSSTEFAVVLARGQHWESVTITARGKTWRYPQRLFGRIPWESWQRGPFESRRTFVRLDSRGHVYLSSANHVTVAQPPGFPLQPEKT